MATFEDHEVAGEGDPAHFSNLAYLDQAYEDPATRAKVASLLSQELARSGSAAPKESAGSTSAEVEAKWPLGPCARNEVLRQKGGKAMDKVDFEGRLEAMRRGAKTAAEKVRVERLCAAYAGIQQTNIGLSRHFAEAEWKLRLRDLEGLVAKGEYDAEALRSEVEGVNQTREMEQAGAARALASAANEYMVLLRKNVQIRNACDAIEMEEL